MTDLSPFAASYDGLFRTLGLSLGASHATPRDAVLAAERRLGIAAPPALRDYVLLAGRHPVNRVHNRLLPPEKWSCDAARLVFLEEAQRAVVWSVLVDGDDDPWVFQGEGEAGPWYEEEVRAATFLRVHLVWQAAFGGGFEHGGSGPAGATTEAALAGWEHVGEANGMRAYVRPGQAVCVLPWEGGVRAFVGAATAGGVESAARALGVALD